MNWGLLSSLHLSLANTRSGKKTRASRTDAHTQHAHNDWFKKTMSVSTQYKREKNQQPHKITRYRTVIRFQLHFKWNSHQMSTKISQHSFHLVASHYFFFSFVLFLFVLFLVVFVFHIHLSLFSLFKAKKISPPLLFTCVRFTVLYYSNVYVCIRLGFLF